MKKDYTRDFNDIEYFIDHVSNINARIDVLQKLGYNPFSSYYVIKKYFLIFPWEFIPLT